MLMQNDTVLNYASRGLKKHELNYLTHDIEIIVVIFALKIWRHCLYKVKCEIFTNYKSLQYALSGKKKEFEAKEKGRVV